jgi:hypothetical protein
MRHASWIGALGTIVMVAGTAVGATAPHVRGANAEACDLLVRATAKAPTVARLVQDLEATGVIVVVELRRLRTGVSGLVQVTAATPEVRYLRIALSVPNTESELIATLAHELRHALEIAGMPDVRDDASLAAAYRRIGWPALGNGYFETDAALEAGRAVAKELTAAR